MCTYELRQAEQSVVNANRREPSALELTHRDFNLDICWRLDDSIETTAATGGLANDVLTVKLNNYQLGGVYISLAI